MCLRPCTFIKKIQNRTMKELGKSEIPVQATPSPEYPV